MPNIIGEPFRDYVCQQINVRQKAHGSGTKGNDRTPENLTYLNSKTAWIKLASGIYIEPFRLAAGGKDEEINDGYAGIELAKNNVLFGGISRLDSSAYLKQRGTYNDANNIWDYYKGTYNVNANLNNNSVTGEFGLVPMPGITSAEIKCLNRGSIKKATVSIKCYSPEQFQILNLLYLRIGYTMLLEWGWSPYLDNSGNLIYDYTTLIEREFFNSSNNHMSHLKWLEKINAERAAKNGNYDALLCKVTNLTWTFNNDGSYDIELTLISLGDVVESLKCNITPSLPLFQVVNTTYILFNSEGIAPLITDRFAPNPVENTITAYLFLQELGLDQRFNPDGYDLDDLQNWNNSNVTNEINGDPIRLTSVFVHPLDIPGLDILPKRNLWDMIYLNYNDQENDTDEINPDGFYMRLGHLLEYIAENVVPKIEQGGTLESLITIDYGTGAFSVDDNNRMYVFPFQFSLDPRVCVVNAGEIIGEGAESKKMFFNLPEWKNPEGYGNTMNIFVSHNQIRKSIEANTDDKNNLSLFEFLEDLCTEINKALGGVNNLEPVIDEEESVLKIIDSSYSPYSETDCYTLELYGYKDDTSNFVHDFEIKTEITNEFATMATIGSTAGGYVKGTENTMFSKWNKGLKDRYKEKLVPGDHLSRTTGVASSPEPKEMYLEEIWKGKESVWGCTRYDTESWEILDFETGGTYWESLGLNNEIIDQNLSITSEFYRFCHYEIQNTYNSEYASTTNGFIPISLGVTMEGISGIKIYNAVNVDTRFLPSDYLESLKFIIKGVNHSIKDGNWDTSIETVVIAKNSTDKFIPTFASNTSAAPTLPQTTPPPPPISGYTPMAVSTTYVAPQPLPPNLPPIPGVIPPSP